MSATSFLMFGQKKRRSSLAVVFVRPKCPASGDLCAILNTISRYWNGSTICWISPAWCGGIHFLISTPWEYVNGDDSVAVRLLHISSDRSVS